MMSARPDLEVFQVLLAALLELLPHCIIGTISVAQSIRLRVVDVDRETLLLPVLL